MRKISSSTFWQTSFVFTFLANLVILVWSITRWIELKVIMWRSVWMIPLVLYISALAGCVLLFLWIRKGNAGRLLDYLEKFPGEKLKIPTPVPALIFVGVVVLIPYLKFTFRVGEVVKKSTQDPVLTMIVFYWAVWWLVLIASSAFKLTFRSSWATGFAGALVTMGVCYEVFLRLQMVTPYPFSMGWSEASRYYYGSLFFAKSIYGIALPLSTLHPSRYLLQSFPFLFSNLGLVASRSWQFFLWVGLSAISAITLAWRAFDAREYSQPNPDSQVDLNRNWIKALFAGWVFLFLLRVGVYYHLEIMVFVPLLFVSARHPWRSLAVVIASSAWAGISRVNWFPMPAMLAIAIYLLEQNLTPGAGIRRIGRYLALPAGWGLAGLISALAAQAAYIPLSGNAQNVQAFASSFSSAKLWYRLWPNDSYPLGIVPAILIVSGPLLVTLAVASLKHFKTMHIIRWAGLWSMLLALFAGGLVVSVKIGGGGDLHNMDAFAVLLCVVSAYFIGGRVREETGSVSGSWQALNWPISATALLIPMVFLVFQLSPMPKYHQAANQQAFKQLKGLVELASAQGPVLFINERHLLTFHKINVPLVPEYEAVTFMEMAMSNNQVYLQQFYQDLKTHRFAAIVTGKQNVGIKEEGAFAEENNTWNSRVSPYILCYYEPIVVVSEPEPITYIEADESRIEVYLPRLIPQACP